MGEKTILEQKVDTIMDWIKKQDDERCKKVVIGTFGRNSLRELIYDACDATGLSITEEESKKINRKLKEIIDKNLTETTEKIMKAIKEEDAETYKNICTGRIYLFEKMPVIENTGKNLGYNFTKNELKSINRRWGIITDNKSIKVVKELMNKISKLPSAKKDEENKDEIDIIIDENIKNIEKYDLIKQVKYGTLNVENKEIEIFIEKILEQIEETNLGTKAYFDLINLFKLEINCRLTQRANKYIEQIKYKAENESKLEIKEKYLRLYRKIHIGTINEEELKMCYIYINLNEITDPNGKIRERIRNLVNIYFVKITSV